jgi:NAD(P)-dependent dehydrogenase (short-subunit alcohol dehydrogenase family)
MKTPVDLTGRLDGKTAVVTGGTRGIGRATVLALAQAGARVATCYRRDEAAARELSASGAAELVVQADLTDLDSVNALAGECKATFGKVDILVNNAGIDATEMMSDISDQRWAEVLDVNLATLHRTTREFLPLMRRGGSIVNVGSGVALRGLPGRTHYGAAKAGVIGLSRSLAREAGPRGIRVNTVAPGVIETEPDAGLPKPIAQQIASATSLGRLGGPDEVARVVVFLAGDSARYLTGTTIAVDGGM